MRVVLALDDSKDSMPAVQFLTSLPFRELTDITIVTALTGTYDLIATDKKVALREKQRQIVQARYEQAKSVLEGVCKRIELVVEERHPNQLILEVAKQRSADLIVVGARGHSAVYRALLGSTADFVVNHAHCPVLVVRPKSQAAEQENTVAFHIMLACDATPQARLAAEQLRQFDWPKESTAIHMVSMLERPKLIPEESVYDPSLIAETTASLRELCETVGIDCPMTHTVRETLHIGNALTTLAEQDGTNLLFVGGTGKSMLMRFFLGSTSRYLLHHAACSIWVAREKNWHE